MEGRTRISRARRKQQRADELWSGPDERPKTKCYLCRRECVTEGLRYWARPKKDKPFICPWCRGRNLKFIWGCVTFTLAMSRRQCLNEGKKKHNYLECKSIPCTAKRIMKMRKG